MRKNSLRTLFKAFISIFFLYIVLRMIDFHKLSEILKGCYIPLAVLSLLIAVVLSFPLTFRWYLLLKGQVSEKISYINLWKLSMVGILFNNFLPTGAGGDIVKVFYLVRGEEKKLLLGSSVLIDRFTGSMTVITMGVVAGLLAHNIPLRVKYLLLLLLIILILIFLFFSNRKIAVFFYSKVKKLLPERINETLKNTYSAFNSYFSAKRWFFYALVVSFLMQSVAILNNYLMAHSLLWYQSSTPSLQLFFIYIPLIWTATIIPSIGGLGIREFTYVYFFSSSMGKENAFALSIIFLLSVVIQSIIGAIILLFLKER